MAHNPTSKYFPVFFTLYPQSIFIVIYALLCTLFSPTMRIPLGSLDQQPQIHDPLRLLMWATSWLSFSF